MFPIRDHNPSRTTPVVTWTLIGLNVFVYFWTVSTATSDAALIAIYDAYALVPAEGDLYTYVTSQFLHGGPLHLAGNMLFLYIYGDNLEDEMGRAPYLGFYLLGGVAAGLAQTLSEPASSIPMVGASGAIAAVMGGYLLLFPRARVDVFFLLVIIPLIVPVRAWLVLAAWFGIQVFSGANTPAGAGGVAYWAHAGGFAAGLALTIPLWLGRGGPRFWRRTLGAPPHPEARYPFRRTDVPRAGKGRRASGPWGRRR